MASRCGCPDCVEHRSGCGVDVEYTREDQCDIYTYRFDGECVAGDGLWWDGSQLNVKLRPDGGLSFDNNGALQLADEPDCTWPATVCALEGRKYHQDVVVGALGAGFQYKPQTTFRAYTHAAESGLDVVHVPVRMLRDGTPAVTPETHMTVQNGSLCPHDPPWREVQREHPESWRRNQRQEISEALNPLVECAPLADDMRNGWFGYFDAPERHENAMPVLTDVVQTIGNKAVIVVHLMWPPVSADGTQWVHPTLPDGVTPDPNFPTTVPTPDTRVEAFLTSVKKTIEHHALQRSVIVMSHPDIPTQDSSVQRDVLTPFARAGITVAPHLETKKHVDRYPMTDPRWSEWGWVVMNTFELDETGQPARVPAARMRSYADAGKYGLWWQLTRHSEFREYMRDSHALGSFSTDPAYTSGGLPVGKHCLDCGDTRYREPEPDWSLGFIKHGILGPVEDAYWADANGRSQASPLVRGAMLPQQDTAPTAPAIPRGEYHLGPGSETSAGGPTFFVAQGYLELPDPEAYRLRFWIDARHDRGVVDAIEGLVSARDVRAEVAFAMPFDQRFADFPSAPDKHGYVLSFSTFKRDLGGGLLPDLLPDLTGLRWHQQLSLWVWDPAANNGQGGNVRLAQWQAVSILKEGYVGVEIHVNPDRIWVAPVDRESWQTIRDDTGLLPSTQNQFAPYDSSADTVNGHLGRGDSGNRGRNIFLGRAVGTGEPITGDVEEARFAHWTTTPGEQVPPPYPPPATPTVAGPDEPDRRSVLQIVRDAVDGDPET